MTEDDEDDEGDLLACVIDAVGRGDLKVATNLALSALKGGHEHPIVLLLVAEEKEKAGHPEQAIELIEKATKLAPREPELWRRLGGTYSRVGMFSAALDAYEAALSLQPDAYATLVAAGAAAANIAKLHKARDLYRRALKLAPNEAELLSALAVIASYLQDFEETRLLAGRALELRPESFGAQIAIARAELLEGDPKLAEAHLTSLLGRDDISDEQRISALDLRGEARDELDRPSDAFADYEARNTLVERAAAPRMRVAQAERRTDQARRLAEYFAAAPKAAWRVAAGVDAKATRPTGGHVFLLGFPRSGTTLLEKALAGHPGIATLEEVDHLATAGANFWRDNSTLARLANLTPAEADVCRETYWNGVRRTLAIDISGRILVDKLPLHTPAIPVIAKLFPDARILFALRDPRDVVLSCFRRRFQINSAMYEFLTLDGTARYYDRIMALASIYRDLFLLTIRDVRHEVVVADFEAELRKILEFVGADWNAAVASFAERARSSPKTPSDLQLLRGLDSDGVARWRRYRRQLAPIFPLLDSWVERFGYDRSPMKEWD